MEKRWMNQLVRAIAVVPALGLSLDRLRDEIEPHMRRGSTDPKLSRRATIQLMRVRDLAEAEAVRLGRDHVGTEHQILGLLRDRDGLAGKLLRGMGVDLDRAREAARTIPASAPATISPLGR
jgi:ATP-dependent Clp protease ATP-binding subunit ClpC